MQSEDKLLKTSSVEKIGERVEIDLQNNSNKMRENVSANAESTKWEEELIEIDVSEKTDDLIIKSMDYRSQKRNLFYNVKDL